MKPPKDQRKSQKKKRKQASPEDSGGASPRQYDNPIAERSEIIDVLEAIAKPVELSALADTLRLTGDEQREALRRRVMAMRRDGQVHIDRRGHIGLSDRLELQRCRVQGHRDGYGFAVPLDGGDDYYLSSREMQRVFDGDRVLVANSGVGPRGKAAGKVVEVLERAVEMLPGRYMEESGIGYLLPYNTRITQHILIPPKAKRGAVAGQMVSVRITDYPTPVLGAKGVVEEILGDHLDPGLEIDIAIRAHQIPWEWPEAVLAEAGAVGEEPDKADKAGRIDLRHLPFVTIDGEDARDFDDAVYCEEVPGGFRLWVAIADVSHYVAPGSALDDEAAERGNSVYFPERVVPMFPEVLSNGLCSLKPKVDRLAMVCELSIDSAGEVGGSQFYEAVIHSHARLTYTEVGQVLAQELCDSVDPARVPDLRRLHALYGILRQARVQRGAIDFETVETRILFNAERKIEAIVPVQRNDAHKLIEECMLAANVATATFLETTEVPVLYRVHNGPSAERLGSLRDYLGELSLDLAGGDQPTPVDYQRLINAIAQRDDASIIQTQVLRSLSQACYQIDNEGHFGLNYPAYGHFTSPIRRYPDLLVHRAIRHLIRSGKHPEQTRSAKRRGKKVSSVGYPYDDKTMAALGEQCSMTERRADDATREVEAWLKCEFLRDKVGEQFEGVISAVTGFGIFVELAGLYIEGLVHISGLPGDYYHFDAAKQRLVGERTRRVFKMGGCVEVTVSRVDLQERRVDLDIVDGDGSAQKSRKSESLQPGKKRRAKSSAPRDKKPRGKKSATRGPSTRRKKR